MSLELPHLADSVEVEVLVLCVRSSSDFVRVLHLLLHFPLKFLLADLFFNLVVLSDF